MLLHYTNLRCLLGFHCATSKENNNNIKYKPLLIVHEIFYNYNNIIIILYYFMPSRCAFIVYTYLYYNTYVFNRPIIILLLLYAPTCMIILNYEILYSLFNDIIIIIIVGVIWTNNFDTFSEQLYRVDAGAVYLATPPSGISSTRKCIIVLVYG